MCADAVSKAIPVGYGPCTAALMNIMPEFFVRKPKYWLNLDAGCDILKGRIYWKN